MLHDIEVAEINPLIVRKSQKNVEQRHTFFDDFEENHCAEGDCSIIESPASPSVSIHSVYT